MPSRRHVTLMVIIVASIAFVATALASSTYGGPKTWLPGYAANDGYDNSANRWRHNSFDQISYHSSPYYLALDTFIKSDGSWSNTQQDSTGITFAVYGAGQFNFQKKPHCQNTSSHTYVGACTATADAP